MKKIALSRILGVLTTAMFLGGCLTFPTRAVNGQQTKLPAQDVHPVTVVNNDPAPVPQQPATNVATKGQIIEAAKIMTVVVNHFGVNLFDVNLAHKDLTNAQLVNFGIAYANYKPKKVAADGTYQLPAKYVKAAVARYFLKENEVKLISISGHPYSKGAYKTTAPQNDHGYVIKNLKITHHEAGEDWYWATAEVYHKYLNGRKGEYFFRCGRIMIEEYFPDPSKSKKSRYIVRAYQLFNGDSCRQ